MRSRQFARPGAKRPAARLARSHRESHVWRGAFASLCALTLAVYALSVLLR